MDLLEVTMLSYMAFGVVAQVYRYLRVSDPLERQQTKWVLVSLILFISLTGLLIIFFPNVFAASVALTPSDLAVWGIFYFLLVNVMMLFFGGITMAVLRYRLWDIDILIRRTLVYALLTAALILVYFGSVILLQTLFATVTGQQSAGAIVISTLIIAALFQPLRQRIQAWIDRRFFRAKYDANQALARFSQTARDEVDLEQLTAALLQVTRDTLHPESVFLWLPSQLDESNWYDSC